MRNIRLTVEYDGTAYCGWQRQINGLSIQQRLEEAIGRITGEESRVIGSGRTDAGVHAWGQVAHFHTASLLGERNLLMGINSLLPVDIAVREVREVDPAFHARFDAVSKVYIYRICNRPVRPALDRHRAWFVWCPLDLEKIRGALDLFLGRHDFSSFCSVKTDSPDHVRTILDIGSGEGRKRDDRDFHGSRRLSPVYGPLHRRHPGGDRPGEVLAGRCRLDSGGEGSQKGGPHGAAAGAISQGSEIRMKILVLGYKGMLGSDLMLRLASAHDVTGKDVDDFDITVEDDCRRVVDECSPDVVINAAAYTNVDGCEAGRDRCFLVNATGVKNIALACRGRGILIVHFSTDYVFDGQKAAPYTEEDEPVPLNVYGASKREGERFLQALSDRWLLIRTAWLYGGAARIL